MRPRGPDRTPASPLAVNALHAHSNAPPPHRLHTKGSSQGAGWGLASAGAQQGAGLARLAGYAHWGWPKWHTGGGGGTDSLRQESHQPRKQQIPDEKTIVGTVTSHPE